jgi:TolA-binding protein
MATRPGLIFLLAAASSGLLISCSSPAARELAAGRRALGQGRYHEAIERFNEVTIEAPGSAEAAQALYEMALIRYLRQRDVDSALTTFRKLLRSYPDHPLARDARRLLARMYQEDLGEPEKAIQEYEILLKDETDPEERKAFLLEIADCRYTADDLEAAAEAYHRVIEAFPRDPESASAYLRLAHIQRLTGRTEEAFTNLQAVLRTAKDRPSRRKAYEMRAEMLAEEGQYHEAQSCLAEAAREFPDDSEMTELLSRIREQETARALAEGEGESGEWRRWGSARP